MPAEHRTELDTNRSVPRSVLALALPSMAVQIVLVLYNMTDTFFIGLTGSDVMVTAVTVSTPAFMFLTAIANLFGIGASGTISRALGRRDAERAKSASRFAFWGCGLTAGAYALFSFFCGSLFIDLLGGRDPAVHPLALQYIFLTVAAAGVPTVLNNYLAHLIRSEGRSAHASFGLAMGGLLNIALDPLFMFVLLPPGQEVAGAAAATALSNCIALAYYVILLLVFRAKHATLLSFVPARNMFGEGIPKDIIRTGLPACVMTLCENISYAVLENLILAAGLSAQAGLGVAKKINMLAHSLVRGVSQGVLPLIGFTYASGNQERLKRVMRFTLLLSIGTALGCTAAFLTFARPLSGLFLHADGRTLRLGVLFLRILCTGAPFSALAYTVISFFQAVSQSGKSLLLALLRKGILDIPLMFVLFALFRPTAAVIATPAADAICCLTAIVLFVRWRRMYERKPIEVFGKS